MIKEFRKKYGLTRKALGEMLGVSVPAIYRWEHGDRKVSKTVEILLSWIEKDLEKKRPAKKRMKGRG
jgi:transcriptional regulator with XRE-family HTH domain